jgi:hypothetical protein
MNREDIIRMAREAGFSEIQTDLMPYKFERFAALVAAAERERFALECIDLVAFHGGSIEIEAAIRARGQA